MLPVQIPIITHNAIINLLIKYLPICNSSKNNKSANNVRKFADLRCIIIKMTSLISITEN